MDPCFRRDDEQNGKGVTSKLLKILQLAAIRFSPRHDLNAVLSLAAPFLQANDKSLARAMFLHESSKTF